MNKNKTIKPEKPGGFIDWLPADYLAREKIINTVARVFQSFGFDPIETPKVEFFKTLSGEESETGKQIFNLKSGDERESLALIFDYTVPLARLVAANPYDNQKKTGIKLPWKRMAMGPVFRGERPQAGRYRQFYQFDADIVGTSSMLADAEISNLIYITLNSLGVEDFTIKLNNRKILNGLAQLVDIKDRNGVKAEEIVKEMMRILDKMDKIGKKKVLNQLQEKSASLDLSAPNLTKEQITKINSYLDIKGSNKEKLDKCQELFSGIAIAEEGIEELRQILKYLKAMKVPEKFVEIDFNIIRGLDYYTGPVMETFLNQAKQFGSIFSGGRYNDLIKRFTGQELPAVGASVGVDRLFVALDSLGLLDKSKTTVSEAMVLRLANDKDKEYLEMAKEIRRIGLNTELSLLDDTTFKSQFNYALSRGVKYAIICGEDEFKNNKIQVKNLETREQKEIKRDELKDYFSKI